MSHPGKHPGARLSRPRPMAGRSNSTWCVVRHRRPPGQLNRLWSGRPDDLGVFPEARVDTSIKKDFAAICYVPAGPRAKQVWRVYEALYYSVPGLWGRLARCCGGYAAVYHAVRLGTIWTAVPRAAHGGWTVSLQCREGRVTVSGPPGPASEE
jgi:hypothetical protein